MDSGIPYTEKISINRAISKHSLSSQDSFDNNYFFNTLYTTEGKDYIE